MTNHNIPENRHEHPLQMNERGRKIVKGTFIAIGGAALLYGSMNQVAANSGKNLDHTDQARSPIINESLYKNGPIDPLHSIKSTINEGDATSVVVEKASLKLAEQENIDLKPGQSAVNNESSRYIDGITHELTGGSVEPGAIIESWVDPVTGFVISTRLIGDTK